jgi:hypothetical protein
MLHDTGHFKMSKIIVALVKASTVIGSYVADDKPLSPSPNYALGFSSVEQAQQHAKLNNEQWALGDDEMFIVLRTIGNGLYERA